MPIPTLPSPESTSNMSLEELRNLVAILLKELHYLLAHLDTKNIMEVGGWRLTPTQLASKDGKVGMSSEETPGDDIRFWAGDVKTGAPKFKVTKAGIATLISMILQSVASGHRIEINSTGFHSYDSLGVERITIGTTPAKGAKAIFVYGSTGPSSTLAGFWVYDTETVDGASRTGSYFIGPGPSVLLFSEDGDIRLMKSPDGAGLRIVGTGFPQAKDAFGAWAEIAKKSEADARGFTLDTGTANTVKLLDKNGNVLNSVTLNINKTSSSYSHLHGITSGRYVQTYDSAGNPLGLQQFTSDSHSHTVT